MKYFGIYTPPEIRAEPDLTVLAIMEAAERKAIETFIGHIHVYLDPQNRYQGYFGMVPNVAHAQVVLKLLEAHIGS